MHIYKYTCLNCRGRAGLCAGLLPAGRMQSSEPPHPTLPARGHPSLPRAGPACALKVFSLCKTRSLQTKAFVIVLPGLQKYRSPTARNVKVK